MVRTSDTQIKFDKPKPGSLFTLSDFFKYISKLQSDKVYRTFTDMINNVLFL